VFAEEPGGFRDRAWGTRWDEDAIRSLPGCHAQGETIADVEGYVAVVAQPECVGYRFAADLTVNLVLIYPEIKWHGLEQSRLVVENLLTLRTIWGLAPETTARLERWSAELDRLSRLRTLYGTDAPVFPDMAYHTFDLPEAGRGLQGYQINFRRDQYVTVKAALIRQLGAPTRETDDEVLEWLGDKTVAVMRERGNAAASGYFVVITRAYLDLVKTGLAANVVTRRSTPYSRPWFLQLVEGFDWARNRDDLSVGSDSGSRASSRSR
jgi:hypothetical protein